MTIGDTATAPASAADSARAARAAETVTVGVVIDLPEPHASVIRGWRARSGDPQGAAIPPHVTLLAPTAVRRDELDDAVAHLSAVAADAEPFSMHLAGTGSFRPTSQVVFVQVANGQTECKALEAAIRRGPLDRPREFPYHPHVTVAHDVDSDALDEACSGLGDFVARFRVSQFALFTRESGVWTEQRMFELGKR
jgi:2'-5' RNA ligase